MRYVDIHSHILPRLDDGSKDLSMTKTMLQMAVDEGIEAIIATPHHRIGYSHYEVADYNKTYDDIQQYIKDENLPLKLYQGQELYFDYNNLKDIKSNKALSMAGSRYILFELPSFFTMDSLTEYLYEFELTEHRLILAHVERYEQFKKRPELLLELSRKGVLFQVNSQSINSKDKRIKKWVDKLLIHGYVDFVSTDCHSKGRRRPMMEASYQYVKDLIGEAARDLFHNNGMKVIQNEEIITNEPKEFRKRFVFKRR